MNLIFPLVLRLFTGETGAFFARLKKIAGMYVILALLFLALLFFLGLALFVWLAQHFGTLHTALGFAGGLFVLLVVAIILLMLAKRQPAKATDDRLQRDIASIAGVAALTNAPQILRAVGRRKGLLVVPVVGAALYIVYAMVTGFRRT